MKDLSSDDATKAFAAQRALAANGDLAVAQLAKRVPSAEGRQISAKELAALVKGLDDDDPDVRVTSAASLEDHGSAAEAVLLAAQGYFDLVKARALVGVVKEAIKISEDYQGQLHAGVSAGISFRGDDLRVQTQAVDYTSLTVGELRRSD